MRNGPCTQKLAMERPQVNNEESTREDSPEQPISVGTTSSTGTSVKQDILIGVPKMWHTEEPRGDIVVPKSEVHLTSVQYTNTHTEQWYFIACLCRYGCLSQDSTPQASRSSYLYTKHEHVQVPNTYTLLFH